MQTIVPAVRHASRIVLSRRRDETTVRDVRLYSWRMHISTRRTHVHPFPIVPPHVPPQSCTDIPLNRFKIDLPPPQSLIATPCPPLGLPALHLTPQPPLRPPAPPQLRPHQPPRPYFVGWITHLSSNNVSPPNTAPINTPSGFSACLICVNVPTISPIQCRPEPDTTASICSVEASSAMRGWARRSDVGCWIFSTGTVGLVGVYVHWIALVLGGWGNLEMRDEGRGNEGTRERGRAVRREGGKREGLMCWMGHVAGRRFKLSGG